MYHTYTTQKHTSNSATVWEPSIFFFLNPHSTCFSQSFFLVYYIRYRLMYFDFLCREKFDGTGTQGQRACNSTSKKFQQYRQRRRIGKRAIGENIFYCIMSPFSGCYFVSCRSLQSSFRSKKKKSLQSSFVGISPSVHLQFLLHRVNRQLK